MKNQFTEEVFPAELEEITRRRREQDLPCPNLAGPPSVRKGLTGLALSGGGIRSATFSLGVIQALIRRDLFRFIDYLSTVSGGGYIGSCVSSVLNQPGISQSAFENRVGAEDTPAVKQLRNNSNYLVAGGAFDKMRLPMILLRGILLNLWLIIPPLIIAVFFTELATELWHRAGAPAVSPLIVIAPFIVLALLYPFLLRVIGRSFHWRLRNFYERALAAVFSLSLILLLLVPIFWLVRYCIDNNWNGHIREFLHQTRLLQIAIVIFGSIALVLLIKAFRYFPTVVRLVINISVAVVGPFIVFGIYLLFCIFFVQSPYFENAIDPYEPHETYNYHSEILNDLGRKKGQKLSEGDAAAFNILAREISENALNIPPLSQGNPNPVSIQTSDPGPKKKEWSISLGEGKSVRIEGSGPTPYTHALSLFHSIPIDSLEDVNFLFMPELSLLNGHAAWEFYIVGVAMILLNFFFFDANVISTHSFYRDRLSRAFLFKAREDSSIEPNDDQKLSDLNAEGSSAPYHLINTALNLPASTDVNLRGRNADFFTLSKRYCGGEHTRYCETPELEEIDRHLNLGSAMAISAAAAAPNMGSSTKKYFVFIMTLLNLRLGYWIPNPSKIIPAGPLKKFLWPNVGPRFLFQEALGKLDARGSHVNLSDGGHIENLAIYQLLRRRCKLIIAVDAEADPEASFHGLVTLIRFAKIDLGIRIDLALEDFQKDEMGNSKTHWTLATVHYGTGEDGKPETGHLLYLKSSLTGDENEYVKAYRNNDPTFPHQTTADQFFDETQFEVYRSLGAHIAHNALADPAVEKILASAGAETDPGAPQ